MWKIYQDAHGDWRWWKLDDKEDIIEASEHGFATQQACEENATIYGYQA